MLYSLIYFFVETGCTSKLLQGEMCQLSINKMTRSIMKNVSVVAMAFNILVSCVYIEVQKHFEKMKRM